MESKHHSHDDHTECCHHHDKHDHCKCADHHHHEHGPSCGCGHDHEHTLLPIQVTLAGVLFIVNSFVLDRFYGSDSMLSAMSALIGALIMGVPIVWTSIKDLFKGVLSINELVTLAVMAAFASGNYQTAGIVAFFMLLGEIIEMRTADGARKSIESLIKLAPTKARRLLKDGTEEEVPVSMLQIGDVVRVRPGDNVSADGVIVSGQGSFNQANITGESLPVDKKPGDEVFAGTQNLTGVLEIRVSRAGQDTTLGQVHNLILAAEKTRLPILRIIDQYMQYYTPMVLVIATLVWAFTFDLERVIAVLIVACPCAFILATPSAMVAALSAAARLGILIKNVSDIELAARINAFVFDKTGTLTQGKLIVNRLYPVEGVQPAELLQIAASAEKYSNHPTAKAINLLAKEAEIELSEPSDFSETAGRGVSAKVENMAVIIGRSQWLKDNGVSGDFLNSVDLNEAEGFSVLFVARNGQFIGWIGLQDETRAEAKESLADLMQNGVRRIAMVTGDRRPVAARVAKEIGCEEIVAECLPQDKVEFVTMMRERGYRVAVVGDGVNDAPALAAGDVGIAMGAAGSEVAINSATIALMNNDLKRLPFLVKLSRSTRSVINQNFLFGTLFIIFGLGFASWGYINPIVAALLHNAGSLLVVFNSARLVRQGEELDGIQIGEASADTPAKQS
ncbi:MAG: cadmium-translocating P-type ATPase [Verrucomicrobia bacterium]|nr:cadmium-translocating P-type ATPase [Verrucomicrobiota bacterium]